MNRKTVIIAISVFVLLVLGAGLFYVLTSKDKSAEIAVTGLTQPTGTVAGGSEDIKGTMLTFCFMDYEPAARKEVLANLNKKLKEELGMALDFKFFPQSPPSEYISEVSAMNASGQSVDAFYYGAWFSTYDTQPCSLKDLADMGMAMDITTLFPEYAPEYFRKFDGTELKAASVDKKLYAVPFRNVSSGMRCALVRSDLLDKYKVSGIDGYKEFGLFLENVKNNEPGVTPLLTSLIEGNNRAPAALATMHLFAGEYGYTVLDNIEKLLCKCDDPAMKIIPYEQAPEFTDFLAEMNSWYEKGYITKELEPEWIDVKMLSSGKYASFIDGWGSNIYYNQTLENAGSGYRYKAFPLISEGYGVRDNPLGAAILINAKSGKAPEILKFIEWLQSKQENYDLLMYGIEGKTYTLENNRVKLPGGIRMDQSYFNWSWRWPFTNIEFERADTSNTIEDLKEYYDVLRNNTRYAPHMGFVPDYNSVIDVTNSRDFNYDSFEVNLISGTLDRNQIEGFIAKQKEAGIDTLLQAVQGQLDSWRQNN